LIAAPPALPELHELRSFRRNDRDALGQFAAQQAVLSLQVFDLANQLPIRGTCQVKQKRLAKPKHRVCRGAASGRRAGRLGRAPLFAALLARDSGVRHASAAARFVTAFRFPIHGRPGSASRFGFRNAAFLIAFRDMFRFAFLFVGVTRLISARHERAPFVKVKGGERRLLSENRVPPAPEKGKGASQGPKSLAGAPNSNALA
jgi:hypothetical protein